MKMEFTKMHGTGNDYVYVNCMEQELPNPGAISEYISHRRFGIGSDGLNLYRKSDLRGAFSMKVNRRKEVKTHSKLKSLYSSI